MVYHVMRCEACGEHFELRQAWSARKIRRLPCPDCDWIALTPLTAEEAEESLAFVDHCAAYLAAHPPTEPASRSEPAETPPVTSLDSDETPLEAWLAGVEALLAELHQHR